MPRQSNVTLSVLGKCIPNFAQKYRKQKIGNQAFYGVKNCVWIQTKYFPYSLGTVRIHTVRFKFDHWFKLTEKHSWAVPGRSVTRSIGARLILTTEYPFSPLAVCRVYPSLSGVVKRSKVYTYKPVSGSGSVWSLCFWDSGIRIQIN